MTTRLSPAFSAEPKMVTLPINIWPRLPAQQSFPAHKHYSTRLATMTSNGRNVKATPTVNASLPNAENCKGKQYLYRHFQAAFSVYHKSS